MATGTTTIDFGAFPGSMYATVAITGQGAILAGSLVEAWIRPVATADHTADEHLVDPPRVVAGDIIAGTGFTIHGFGGEEASQTFPSTEKNNAAMCHGQWTLAWAWV